MPRDIYRHQKRGTVMGKICTISIYFRKFVYNNLRRVVSICKRIRNKTSTMFLSLYQACSISVQHLQKVS